MIDAGIQIIDRLIQLATYKENKSKDYFNEFIAPLYSDTEKIAADYFKLFQELIHKIRDGEKEEALIRWLERRRIEHLPLRMKVKSLLRADRSDYLRQRFEKGSPDKFQDGIWKLMQGGISLVEPGYVSERGGHTILDVLYRFMYSDANASEEMRRNRYLQSAQYQMDYIMKAWEEVNEGYASLKESIYKSGKKVTKRKQKLP